MIEKIDYNRELMEGFRTAAINMEYQSNPEYRPEFLSNNPRIGKKIFVSIEQELMCCDQFKISVAFITKSGITPLLQVFRELEKKGIPGEILTTDYLLFSEPEALEKIASLKNIQLRIVQVMKPEDFIQKVIFFVEKKFIVLL